MGVPDVPNDIAQVGDAATCSGTFCGAWCVDITSNPFHCGACGNACPAGPNSIPQCVAGMCRPRCVRGHLDCDASLPGCETLASSLMNCGACGRACAGSNMYCADGGGGDFSCEPSCRGSTPCGTVCADFADSPLNCGACGMACPTMPNADSQCNNGVCATRCQTGFADCNGSPADGCERDLRVSTLGCGGCNTVCPTGPNGTPLCRNGTCTHTCMASYGDCDGNAATGCETDVRSSLAHCGMCGRTCAPNAAGTCTNGMCTFMCNAGFADCDMLPTNGCEANLQTSTTHCAACGNRCVPPPSSSATCTAGRCGFTCVSGTGNCNGLSSDGCETNLRLSPNCGMCGVTCVAPMTCTILGCR